MILEEFACIVKCQPPVCGIYYLIKDDHVVYVGQSVNTTARINVHAAARIKDFDSYAVVEASKENLNEAEAEAIVKYNPKYNSSLPINSTFISKVGIKRRSGVEGREINRRLRSAGFGQTTSLCDFGQYYRISEILPLFPTIQ